MYAHVLRVGGKRDKRRTLPSCLSLFRNEFIRAYMLDSIYHMIITLLISRIIDVKTSRSLQLLRMLKGS